MDFCRKLWGFKIMAPQKQRAFITKLNGSVLICDVFFPCSRKWNKNTNFKSVFFDTEKFFKNLLMSFKSRLKGFLFGNHSTPHPTNICVTWFSREKKTEMHPKKNPPHFSNVRNKNLMIMMKRILFKNIQKVFFSTIKMFNAALKQFFC